MVSKVKKKKNAAHEALMKEYDIAKANVFTISKLVSNTNLDLYEAIAILNKAGDKEATARALRREALSLLAVANDEVNNVIVQLVNAEIVS